MSVAGLERIPGPVRRIVLFSIAGALVYVVLLAVGGVLFAPDVSSGSSYALASTVAAGFAAFYLVYLGGFRRLRDLLR